MIEWDDTVGWRGERIGGFGGSACWLMFYRIVDTEFPEWQIALTGDD